MDWQNQNGNPRNNGNPYNNGNSYNNGNPYNNNGSWQYRPAPVKSPGDGMAAAAMVLGIISIASLFFMQIYVPFITAGVGIVLAVLSKGSAPNMLGRAKAGITCCIVGLAMDILLCVGSVFLVINLPKLMPDMVEEVNEMCEEEYGISYYELMDELENMWNTDETDMPDIPQPER